MSCAEGDGDNVITDSIDNLSPSLLLLAWLGLAQHWLRFVKICYVIVIELSREGGGTLEKDALNFLKIRMSSSLEGDTKYFPGVTKLQGTIILETVLNKLNGR